MFLLLAVVNNAAEFTNTHSIHVDSQISPQVLAFISFGSIPRSGLAGSYGISMFNFIEVAKS